jgi:hypothetical protein
MRIAEDPQPAPAGRAVDGSAGSLNAVHAKACTQQERISQVSRNNEITEPKGCITAIGRGSRSGDAEEPAGAGRIAVGGALARGVAHAVGKNARKNHKSQMSCVRAGRKSDK